MLGILLLQRYMETNPMSHTFDTRKACDTAYAALVAAGFHVVRVGLYTLVFTL